MIDKIRQLKTKKYAATIIIGLLLIFVLGLFTLLSPSIKNIKIDRVLTKTTALNASVDDAITEEVVSNNYDEIKYQLKVNKDKSDTAIITGTLTDKENKYARFKEMKDAVVSDNGKIITVTTTRSKVTITVVISNAPYGTSINPKFNINSEDESKSKIDVDPVVITGKSVEGKIYDEDGTFYKGLELSLNKNSEEVKRTYTRDNGEYVFSLGDVDTYEVKLEEDKYQIVRYTEETVDENRRILNIVIKEVEPFNLEIKKTISKLDLVVNGKKESYDYDDETKVVKSIKNAKTIEGSVYYNISIKNTGEIKGTLTVLKDIIPDGLSFDENKNPGWTKNGKYIYYTVAEGKEIEPFGKLSATLVLDIVKTNEAKTYINTAIASGDDYKYVAYYLNNQLFKEEYVIASEKIQNIDPNVENFGGWYTDKEFTNKYNFDNQVLKDIVLFGKINNKKYNVTFIDINPNTDEETILDIQEVNEGASASLVDTPTYNGYTFKCFKLNDECYESEEITEDVNLYTSYTVNQYDITYDLDGGSLEEDNPSIYTVKYEITLNNPTKEGFTFIGWTGTGLSEPTLEVTIPAGSTGDREYTANYEINKSTLTVDPNGGTYLDNSSSVSYTKDYGTILQIVDSVRSGYTFDGYAKTGGGTFSNGTYTFDNDDATLTANYTIITYRIRYENITDTERATLNNPIIYDVESGNITLKNPGTRLDDDGNNYQDFLGWDDGNGNVSEFVTIPSGSIGDKTYTAVWKENDDSYAITYNLNGGSLPQGVTNPNTYTRQTDDFEIHNPTKTGYIFLGWSGTGIEGLSTNVVVRKGSAGKRTYTAYYQVIPYTISYNGLTESEIATANNPSSYTVETETISLTPPSRNGYTFLGWSGTGIADKSVSVTIPQGSTGNRVYTAHFKKLEYSLTYTYNGGVPSEANPEKYSIDSSPITLHNPTKTGYTFKGWSGTDLVGNENTEVTIPTGSTGHRSFLANYTPITYHITYDYNGGSLEEGATNPTEYTIESPNISFNNPSKEGYIFTNYTFDGNVITSIPTGTIGDIDLVANYEIRKYTVNYYNENSIFSTETVDWNSTTTRPSTDPTKAHHVFLYWTEDGENEYNFNTAVKTDKNLYAVYEEVIAPEISVSPTLDDTTNKTWVCGDSTNNNCGVTVTVSSEHSDYELYYKVGDGPATLYTEPFKVYENTIVTAWSKKSNVNSVSVEDTINNVDTIAPTINQPATGAMSFNMSVSGTAQDASSGVKKFTMYAKEKDALTFDDNFTYTSPDFDGLKDHAENYDHTFYGVQDNTEYIIKIVAEDYVGNVNEIEIEVKTKPYVARVVGKNGILWYTVDPDTKEFVIDEGKEFLMFDSIQSAVNYCANVQCTIQTNPTQPVINESVTVAANQDITIDLDGRGIASTDAATIVNNGKLQIVDRNPREANGEHDGIGFVNNTESKAIVNNNILIIGDGSSEPSEIFVNPELDRPVIYGKVTGIEQNNEFHFYDGKIKSDSLAITDNGDDVITQYSYNVVITEEDNLNVATMERVTDPEARIKSTYYVKLNVRDGGDAVDSSKSGTITREEGNILSKIKQFGDYGFTYDEVNDLIYNGNQSTANTTAVSYVKLDLTDYDENQYLLFDTFADTSGSNSYGYISISEEFGNQGTRIYKTTGNDVEGTKVHFLEKGKIYYIYFGFTKGHNDINVNEVFKVTNFQLLGERQSTSELTLHNDTERYWFEKQDDGSYVSTNAGITYSYAHSYIIYDLRDVDTNTPIDLMINYNVSCHNWNQAYIYANDSPAFKDANNASVKYVGVSGILEDKHVYVPLTPGIVNYVHFAYYRGEYGGVGTDTFTITGIKLHSGKTENLIPESTITHDSNYSYHFEKTDYDIYHWKDTSGNNKHANVTGSIYDGVNKGFKFNQNAPAYIENTNFNLTNYEETVYIEFSTNGTPQRMPLYNGSNNERISLVIIDNTIYVSNEAWVNLYTAPTGYNDGQKHSFMVTYNNGIYELYYDGILMTKRSDTSRWYGHNANTYIGYAIAGLNVYEQFNGMIYNVKVFNKEITPEELNNTENLVLNLDGNDALLPNTGDITFISNNYHLASTTAHSYLTYDLTNVNEDKYLYVNTMINSQDGADIGYVQITDSPNYPNDTVGRQIATSGNRDNQSTIFKLPKNKVSYIHFIYSKNQGNDWDPDRFVIKEVKLFNKIEDAYSVDSNAYSKIDTMYYDSPVVNQKVDTIEILKNITLDTPIVIPQEQEVVLDLNGFTLTSNINDYIIKNNGTLTIKDSAYEDKIQQNVDYRLEQARLFEEAKTRYFEDLALYQEYAGLCEECEPSEEFKLDNFRVDYSLEGTSKKYRVCATGDYDLEVWGAQGGDANGIEGGYGGYSKGTIHLEAGDTLYVTVGGSGSGGMANVSYAGGYNGGGSVPNGGANNRYVASGGGATHIATSSGELRDLADNKDSVIIVAGGGGGGYTHSSTAYRGTGGSGGGNMGSDGEALATNSYYGIGGSQEQAGCSANATNKQCGGFGFGGDAGSDTHGSAGGSGYYGGGGSYAVSGSSNASGAGGSGYIDTSLTNATMVMYTTNSSYESTDPATKTVITTNASSEPISEYAKKGDGYAKISYNITDEEIQELRDNLTKTYTIKEEPKFIDYLDDIDFDGTVNLNQLTPESTPTYNKNVEETRDGKIVTTIANVIVNEEYAKLILDSGIININANSKTAIENRGDLVFNDAVINLNNNSTTGIFNESNGTLSFNGEGTINVIGASSTGLLNRSNTPNISNANITTSQSNDIALNNEARGNITFNNLNITGVGLGFRELSTGNTIINNSNIKSTGTYTLRNDNQTMLSKLEINNSNFNGQIYIGQTEKEVTINNSTMTSIDNAFGRLFINNSNLTYLNNKGEAIVNKSTITGTGNLVYNYARGSYYRNYWNNYAKLLLKDTTINSTDTNTSTNVIDNYDTLTVKNVTINNINGTKSTAIRNQNTNNIPLDYNYSSFIPAYLNIPTTINIDPSFGTAINNTGTVTLGSEYGNIETEYDYAYTGHQEVFEAPVDGSYKLETWGGASSMVNDGAMYNPGYGGYASGTITLNKGDKLYIHVGGMGNDGAFTSYNGARPGYSEYRGAYYEAYNGGGVLSGHNFWGEYITYGVGGGATDISLSSEDNTWNYANKVVTNRRSVASYEQRILVAGGGSGCKTEKTCYGGYNIDPSTSQLGYGSTGGGGGYYGGAYSLGGSSYVSSTLSNPILINGNEEMPDSNSLSGSMQGNRGTGHARITLLTDTQDEVIATPKITATNYGITGTGKLYFYDGTIEANVAINGDIDKVAEDYDIYVKYGTKETMTLVANANSRPVEEGQEEFVCKIGNAKYTTINNALEASNNGDTIELLVNIDEQNQIVIPQDKIITIDYKGHTVKSYNPDSLYKNLGNLTITDSTNTLGKNTFTGNKYIYNTGTLNLSKIFIKNDVYSTSIIDNNDGIITMDAVKIEIANNSYGKIGISNSANGTITVQNSTLTLYEANRMFNNNGTLLIKNSTLNNYAYSQYHVYNNETGNVTLDGNTLKVDGHGGNGRWFLINNGNATIKNMTTNIEKNSNTGTLTLEGTNNIPSGVLDSTGLVIVNSGTYKNTFNINDGGKQIDNTENLYSFIMNGGTINTTLNLNTTKLSSIKGGTISVTSGYAINNTSTGIINLGINDGTVLGKNSTEPIITGQKYGIYTSNPSLLVNFYDGIVTGQKSYNATINSIETGYSIHRDYIESTGLEQKYLTSEALFKNSTQGVYYNSIDALNTALSNGSIQNNDEIRVVRDITVTSSESPIIIPSGLSIVLNIDNRIVDKNNNAFVVNNGELTVTGGWDERLIDIMNKLNSGEYILDTYDYKTEGKYQKFTAPASGTYKIELWGAQGGNNTSDYGKGAYTSGEITLNKGETLYVYVGSKGGSTRAGYREYIEGGYNGGGSTNGQDCCGRSFGSGGGATDVRYFTTTPSNTDLLEDSSLGLASRIMVAAGGGGGFNGSYGGNAGGLVGQSGQSTNGWGPGPGATQVSAGINDYDTTANGSFGIGGSGATSGSSTGGGGGYYGGAGSGHIAAAGGGSSYISGYDGAIAITSSSDLTPKCDENNTSVACSEHFTGKVFSSPIMKSGQEKMPSYSSNSSNVGNIGDGFARITFVNVDMNNIEYSLEDAYKYLVATGGYIPNTDNGIGIVDSTTGSIFENNGILNINSGTFISEKASIETEVIKNNEDATLNITGGTLTKYYDWLGQVYDAKGSIVNNSGIATVTGGNFYTNASYSQHFAYTWTSVTFNNKETGTLTVTGGEYDGITGLTIDYDGTVLNTYNTHRGEVSKTKGVLIYNYGNATIRNIESKQDNIGYNAGTITFDNLTMKNIGQITDGRWGSNDGGFLNLKNIGNVNITNSHFETTNAFINNNGGVVTIENTTIDRSKDGYNVNPYDSEKRTQQLVNNFVSTGEVSIINSELYHRGNGDVIYNKGIFNIEDSTLEASNNNVIVNAGGTLNVKGDTSVISKSGNYSGVTLSNNATFNLGEPIEVDGEVSQTKPLIKGVTYGINNSNSTFNFYDGLIEGKTLAFNGTFTNLELGYIVVYDTDEDYKSNYLDRIPIIQNVTQATAQDEKKYYDLKTAFEEVNDGDTLKLIADYSSLPTDETAVNDNIVTFDINGKILRQSHSLLIQNNGTLNITDDSNNGDGNIMFLAGTNVISNSGTLNIIGGKISSPTQGLQLIKNNADATLNIKDNAKIDSSTRAILIDNSGTTNIYNGAYLHNVDNNGILNKNVLNIVDLNNDDDENTSSNLTAPWINSENAYNNYSTTNYFTIYNYQNATANIYGGIFNNGDTVSPSNATILLNYGTVSIKNLENYAYRIGQNVGTLTITNSNFNVSADNMLGGSGTFNISDTVFKITDFASNYKFIFTGPANLNNVTIYGNDSNTTYRGILMWTNGSTTNITNCNFNIKFDDIFLRNDSTLNIKDTTITGNTGIYNRGNLTIDNTSINMSGYVINSELNKTDIKNNSTLHSTNATALYVHGSTTLNIIGSNTIISDNGIGISLTENAKLNIGEIGGTPDTDTPYIEGTTFGVYNGSLTTTLNFYDGRIVGQTGPNAIYGTLNNVEAEFEPTTVLITDPDTNIGKYNEYLVRSATSVVVAKVGNYSFASVGSITPSRALQNAINFAIGDGTSVKDVDLTTVDIDLVMDEYSITASMPVTINLNNHTINQNSTYNLSSNITLNSNSGVGASVSKLLGDVFDISSKPKDILIYELSDGSKLDTTKTYKLYKDGKVISLEKEELGRYKYKGNNEDLTPIKGRLYLDNLSKGSYKLLSSDNKSIEFSIDSDGNISGNVTENTKDSSESSAIANSEAELILQIQTGKNKYYYWLLIIPIVLIIGLLIIVNKNKKRES